MNRRIVRAALALIGGAAFALTSVGTATAAAPDAAPDEVTMVNGAGKTITLPKTAASQLQNASSAGKSGRSGRAAGKPAKADAKAQPDGFQPDSVIGADDRVKEWDPAGYPWGAIAHLETNQGGCTGFMLSRDVLVTAGHCVYNGGWVTSYRVIPGRDGASEPFGSCSGGIADVWTTWDWISTGSPDHDYGLVKLTCDIGNATGTFGWWYNTGENLVNQYFYVEGFPGDKPYGTMWWDGDYTTAQTATRLSYWIDTYPGQSGSPVYHYNSVTPGLCGGWCVTAIHTNGVGSSPYNSGTRFNPQVMSFINYWVNQP